MTESSLQEYLNREREIANSQKSFNNRKSGIMNLYKSLSGDRVLTKERLQSWKEELIKQGYADQTIVSYVRSVNRYLRYMERTDLVLKLPRYKDLTGQKFGDLTVECLTEKRIRRSCVWVCRCVFGRRTEVPTSRLLTGNTASCGCRKTLKLLQENNQYIAGTELRMSLNEKVKSKRASSGYTGVTKKRNRWIAYINYRGTRYYLGSYERLEDAIAARAKAKAWVKEDALRLQEIYRRKLRGQRKEEL